MAQRRPSPNGRGLLVCCALCVLSGCQAIFSTDWSSAFSSQSNEDQSAWSPSLWSPSTWNPFTTRPKSHDHESSRVTALEAERLRHVLGNSSWQFDPLRLAGPSVPVEALPGHFVGRLSGMDVETAIVRSALVSELENEDPAISTGAAILLAQRSSPLGRERLVSALEDTSLPLAQRCAAAESLGALGLDGALLKEKLLAAREAARPPASQYQSAWHASLVLAVSASLHPSMDAQVMSLLYGDSAPPNSSREEKSLRSECTWPQEDVRAASLLAWRGKAVPLPASARALQHDPLPKMRALYCRVAAVGDAAAEFDYAVDTLTDTELSVRVAAIELLGGMPAGTSEAAVAVEHLRGLLTERGDVLQSAAVESLGRLAAWPDILAAAENKSWRVRQSVARQFELDRAPLPPEVLKSLLTDVNVEVQQTALHSLRGKPLRDSGALLMFALQNSSRVTSTTAETILALKWPAARRLRQAKRQTESRLRLLEQLSAQLAAETTQEIQNAGQQLNGKIENSVARVSDSISVKLTSQESQILHQAVTALLSPQTPAVARDVALSVLQQHGSKLAANLDGVLISAEQEIAGHSSIVESRLLPERIYLDVLPDHDPVFAALRRLAVADNETARQRAVSELAAHAANAELSRSALDRLADLMQHERDAVVWRTALPAIKGSPSLAARRLARQAIAHTDAEVARLACQHLALHGDAQAARLLTDCLDHPAANVAIAAAEGLAQCDRLPDNAALEHQLVSPDRRLRVAAATSLARHELQTGIDALGRLIRDPDPQISRAAATAMGELRRIEFLPVLIEQLDKSLAHRRVVLASLEQITHAYAIGGPESTDPANPKPDWQDWHEARSAELSELPASATEWDAVSVPSQAQPGLQHSSRWDATLQSAPRSGTDQLAEKIQRKSHE
ncbi:MAG: HEAT repeat domain-containing protein [Pirellulales bacterium]|nr:HEAT repeat domain-containing protein [Pirellulales bacterium]